MATAIAACAGRAHASSRAAALTALLVLAASFAPAPPGSCEEPAQVDSLLARAERALDAGDADLAEGLFEDVLSISKGEHRAEHGLAVVGLVRDDFEAVIEHARKAIKRDKKNSEYHMTLARGYGMKAMEGGLASAFYAGKYKGECELAIECDPRNIDAHMGVLQFYVMAPGFLGGGLDKAEETVATIAALDPFAGHQAWAFVARQSDDLEGAEAAYLTAARIDTLDPEGWQPLGMFYIEVSRYEDAIAVAERVLRLDPDEPGAVYQLAKAHLLLGDDLRAAEAGFLRYIESDGRPRRPSLASAHWRLGMVYEKGGDRVSARREWERALGLEPEHEEAAADLDTLRAEHPELW